MVDQPNTVSDEVRPTDPLETVKIEHFEGVGDLTIGVGSNWHIIITALCLTNHPQANKFLLAQQLNLSDRITKTKIFPRDGMALPGGEVYHEPPMEDKKEG